MAPPNRGFTGGGAPPTQEPGVHAEPGDGPAQNLFPEEDDGVHIPAGDDDQDM